MNPRKPHLKQHFSSLQRNERAVKSFGYDGSQKYDTSKTYNNKSPKTRKIIQQDRTPFKAENQKGSSQTEKTLHNKLNNIKSASRDLREETEVFKVTLSEGLKIKDKSIRNLKEKNTLLCDNVDRLNILLEDKEKEIKKLQNDFSEAKKLENTVVAQRALVKEAGINRQKIENEVGRLKVQLALSQRQLSHSRNILETERQKNQLKESALKAEKDESLEDQLKAETLNLSSQLKAAENKIHVLKLKETGLQERLTKQSVQMSKSEEKDRILKFKIEGMEATINSLTQKVNKIEEVENKNKKLEKMLQIKTNLIMQTNQEIKTLRREMEESKMNENSITASLSQKHEADLNQRVSTKEDNTHGSITSQDHLESQSEHGCLQDTIKELKEDKQTLFDSINQMKLKHQNECQSLKNKIKRLTQSVDSSYVVQQTLRENISRLSTEKQHFEDQLSHLKTIVEQAGIENDKRSALEKNETELRIKEIEADRNKISAEFAEAKRSYENGKEILIAQVENERKQNLKYKELIETNDAKIKAALELQVKIDSDRALIAEMSKSNKKLEEEIDNCKANELEVKRELVQQQHENKNSRETIKANESAMLQLKGEILVLQDMLQQTKDDLVNKEAETISIGKCNESLREKLQNSESENNRLKQSVHKQEILVTETTVRNSALEKEISLLKKEKDVWDSLANNKFESVASVKAALGTEIIRWQTRFFQANEKLKIAEKGLLSQGKREGNWSFNEKALLSESVTFEKGDKIKDLGHLKEPFQELIKAKEAQFNLKILLKEAQVTDVATCLEFSQSRDEISQKKLQILLYNITACESSMSIYEPEKARKQQSNRALRLSKLEDELECQQLKRNEYIQVSETNRKRLEKLLESSKEKVDVLERKFEKFINM